MPRAGVHRAPTPTTSFSGRGTPTGPQRFIAFRCALRLVLEQFTNEWATSSLVSIIDDFNTVVTHVSLSRLVQSTLDGKKFDLRSFRLGFSAREIRRIETIFS